MKCGHYENGDDKEEKQNIIKVIDHELVNHEEVLYSS